MQCDDFDAGACRSCSLMGVPYRTQLQDKQNHVETLLAEFEGVDWSAPMGSAESGFRNKAKMVVSGTVDRPMLGILDREGRGIDLSECGLYPEPVLQCMPVLKSLIRSHGLTPYDVPSRRGELKNILVTVSPDGEVMIRFVLRSKKLVVPIRRAMADLRHALPHVRVVSANILREHKAFVEGEEEVPLTDEQLLPMRLNGLTLNLRPQGFFQTNSRIAAGMYEQAAAWAAQRGPDRVWDLYCGVGGFALHAARRLGPRSTVRGVEISAQAIQAAKASAAEAGLNNVTFDDADAGAFAAGSAESPDMMMVNPPRRGLGPAMTEWIEASATSTLMYSSCNARSLVKDLRALSSFRPREAKMFDMFPQTNHYETMVLLERVN